MAKAPVWALSPRREILDPLQKEMSIPTTIPPESLTSHPDLPLVSSAFI